jgi:type II secretory pathway pseudopilin PulG
MALRLTAVQRQKGNAGFTLAEVLVAFGIFALMSAGVIYGYVQANRTAEWSALSLAAQSYAMQGVEQQRAADWNPRGYPPTSGPNTPDEQPPTNLPPQVGIFDVPIKGSPSASDFPFFVTNYITITNITLNPPLRMIRADAVWTCYLNGQTYTNTAILYRAPDQ